MRRETKHRIGGILMLAGFISVIFGGLGLSFITLDAEFSLTAGIGGFLAFLLGAEVYLKTRKELYQD